MKPLSKYRVRMGLVSILFFVLSTYPALAQSDFNYSYFRVSQFGASVELVTLDQLSTEITVATQTYPLPTGWLLSSPRLRSLASPNGEWIVSTLVSVDNSRLMMQIYNPTTNEARQIIEGYITTRGKSVVWSPDSRFLALVVGQGTKNTDVFIYSVADNALTNLTNDELGQYDLGWSWDANRLLTFTLPCQPHESCANRLDLLDIAGGSRLASLDLSSLPLLGNAACDPNLSPDSRYISFILNCGGSGYAFSVDFPNEIYVGNVDTNVLRQVTNFASDMKSQIFQSLYQQHWLNPETLLIGANFRIGETPEQQRFVTYDVSNEMMTVLSSTVGTGFALNADTDQLALQSNSIFNDQTEIGNPIQLMITRLEKSTDAPIEASSLDAINDPINISAACDMKWSPDSKTLAVISSTTNCDLYVESITFINGENGSVQEYPVLLDASETEVYTVPIGWIKS